MNLSIKMLAFIFTVIIFSACEKDSLSTNEIPIANTENTDDTMTRSTDVFYMPSEEEPHAGTWLQWPHDYGYDYDKVRRYESIWVEMAKALHTGEEVYIIVYNQYEKQRVKQLLQRKGLNMNKLQFFVWKTDDVWVRDNGPVYVFDKNDELFITDWDFNGWGGKTDYYYCDRIPNQISRATGIPKIKVNMVNEGGSVELDGNGTLMAKKSSILNANRNPGMTQAEAEDYFRTYLGVENFIWLEGFAGEEITDDHIDGTARFANGNTIVTFAPEDAYEGEYEVMKNAQNAAGEPYEIVHLPFTKRKVRGTGDYASYVNFYVGNEAVIVPNFNDPMDAVANGIIQDLYPNRRVMGIDCRKLWQDGGALHCVTQQVPAY
ncbi:MAG: agmatine/peptidylarginine deiminase [Saprospiraceae bacterium]